MKVPTDYRDLVGHGVTVLLTLAAQLRLRATAQPHAPQLWLSVRDYEGLAGRLGDFDDSEWRAGMVRTFISGQDLGVLDELIARSADAPIHPSAEQAAALQRLRQFLHQYSTGEFEFDDPVAQ